MSKPSIMLMGHRVKSILTGVVYIVHKNYDPEDILNNATVHLRHSGLSSSAGDLFAFADTFDEYYESANNGQQP